MNRRNYFDFIEESLSHLATRIELRGGLNLLDLHLHSENFYRDFLNLILCLKLENMNATKKNAQGIDLIDKTNKTVVQVSSTATQHKIESALTKTPAKYFGYAFMFVAISKDASGLRTKSYSNPRDLVFSPAKDIIDVGSLLAKIEQMTVHEMKGVYEFLKAELKADPDEEKVESNLATIIDILSKVNWNNTNNKIETTPYDIEAKISHNNLIETKKIIEDFGIHYTRVDKIYSEFDLHGANRSLSVLNGIRTLYLKLGNDGTPDQRFFKVVESVKEKIRASSNYKPVPEEELEMSIQIIVVDAFIRCKIFENPRSENNAHT